MMASFSEAIQSPEAFHAWRTNPTPLTEVEQKCVSAFIRHEVSQGRLKEGSTIDDYLKVLKAHHGWFDKETFHRAFEAALAIFQRLQPATSAGINENREILRVLTRKQQEVENEFDDLSWLRWQLHDLQKSMELTPIAGDVSVRAHI